MKCPFCNSDMIFGKIEATGTITFTPEGEKKGGFYSSVSKTGVAISKVTRIRRSMSAQSYYCGICAKVITDIYQNKE